MRKTTEEYTPLYKDTIIKHILGNKNNIEFTKNFIHNITNIPYKQLEDAIVTNKESLNQSYIDSKKFETDMIIRLKSGMKIIIEMQNKNDYESELKNIFYGLRELTEQIPKGGKYKQAKPIYQIIIVKNDKIGRKIKKKLLNEFHLIEKSNNKYVLLNGLYTIKIVDLNCEIEYSEYSEELIGWKNLIKAENLEEAKLAIKGKPVLIQVLKEMKKFMEKVKPRTFEEKFEDDKRIEREEGLKEGKKQGLKEGKQEGVTTATCEIAKNMLLLGEKENKIKAYTKLSLKEILTLKKQLNII